MGTANVGLTKNSRYQVGARKTIPLDPEKAWDTVFSEKGIGIWLGNVNPEVFWDKQEFENSRLKGKLTTVNPGSHIRMQWKQKDWENTSILQLRVIPNKGKTTLSFHQEKLSDAIQRQEMKEYWKKVLDKLEETVC